MTTDSIMKHWNKISRFQLRILPAPVMQVSNVSTVASKSHEVDYPRIISSDWSTTTDADPRDGLKSYDEIERATLFIFPMLKENVVVFTSKCSSIYFCSSIYSLCCKFQKDFYILSNFRIYLGLAFLLQEIS